MDRHRCLSIGQSLAGVFFVILPNLPVAGQFSTILNIPPDPNLPESAAIASDTQINLAAGGSIGNSLQLGAQDGTSSNIELNITGGSVGSLMQAHHGSTVNMSGGSLGSQAFFREGSLLNVSGGLIGISLFGLDGSAINISGGTIAENFRSRNNTVHISGGTIGDGFQLIQGAETTVIGGTIGERFEARDGCHVFMSGGQMGNNVDLLAGAVFNFTGGTVGERFRANANATLNIYGSDFVLAGLNITSLLQFGAPSEVSNRDVTLTGILADGSSFNFDLNKMLIASEDYFDAEATVNIIRVRPGDFNGDGKVNGADFLKWQRGKSPHPFAANDLQSWKSNYGTGFTPLLTSIPEPSSFFGLAALCWPFLVSRSRAER